MTSPNKQIIRDLAKQGFSVPEISHKLNLSRHLVRYHVHPEIQKAHATRAQKRKGDANKIIRSLHGSSCQSCGYNHCIAALDFHHIDPSTKKDNITALVRKGYLKAAREEANKCLLLCSNCHREVHAGVRDVSHLTPRIDDMSKDISFHLTEAGKKKNEKLAGNM